jgi:hypothetical protein
MKPQLLPHLHGILSECPPGLTGQDDDAPQLRSTHRMKYFAAGDINVGFIPNPTGKSLLRFSRVLRPNTELLRHGFTESGRFLLRSLAPHSPHQSEVDAIATAPQVCRIVPV